MRDITEIPKMRVSELHPISEELERDLQQRLRAHLDSPESSEPWESVERSVIGTDQSG